MKQDQEIPFERLRRETPFLAPALILGVALAVYLNSFSGAFQYDDFKVIVSNVRVHSLPDWLRGITGIRPLLKLSYTLNWLAGPGPWGFHLVNLTIHGGNGLLVFALLKRFSPNGSEAGSLALATALIFVAHPAQTEAVTYICGRSTALMTLFYLAALLAYTQARKEGVLAWNLLSVLCFLLACLTKETALTLPVALLLWERAARSWPGLKAALRATSVHWLLLGIMGLGLTLNAQQRELLVTDFSIRSIPLNLLNQVKALGYLLQTWCWPAHLNIDPFLPQALHLTLAITMLALLLLGLLVLGACQLRARPWLGFSLLWFFLHLLPTNSFIPRFDLVNERQLYLSSLGLAFALACAVKAGCRRLSLDGAWAAVILLLILPLGARTILRNRAYRNEIALWRSSVEEAPRNPRAHNNLGYAYLLEGDQAQARKAFETALALKPDYGQARANLESLPPEQK